MACFYILLKSKEGQVWVYEVKDVHLGGAIDNHFECYSGTKRSPHVRTAIIPPTKKPTAVATLIFPGNFSGEKTSVRKNLVQKRKQ